MKSKGFIKRFSKMETAFFASFIMAIFCMLFPLNAQAREITYDGQEVDVYVKPGEPTQVNFPSKIIGGFKKENSSLALDRQDNFIVLFAQPQLINEGEAVIVHLEDSRSYSIRFIPSDEKNKRDATVEIIDSRPPPAPELMEEASIKPKDGFAPPSTVAGMMRQMVLRSEFGKRKPIPGYRASNRYTGEVLLDDGAVEAKIDEILMGSRYWGYVINVENKLQTTQTLNPATFRIDGTQAVSAQSWQLSPRPLTDEQKIANKHQAKVYVITRAKRR